MKKMNDSLGAIQRLASDRQGGEASLLPCMPAGVIGSDDVDEDVAVYCSTKLSLTPKDLSSHR